MPPESYPGHLADDPPLVGRERELALLREALARALTGQGSLALIGGEAGIGKTALAEALCREAAEQGAMTRVGRCYDRTETPPYGPWIELFRSAPASGDGPPLPPLLAAPDSGRGEEITSQAALFARMRAFVATLTGCSTGRPSTGRWPASSCKRGDGRNCANSRTEVGRRCSPPSSVGWRAPGASRSWPGSACVRLYPTGR